ncbi:hypothetical protein [Stappia indica]|uniref:hypothetical protein n=1 Tax=Stappia indica TaxID=538381 RepID=UPI001D18EDF6|nr:hypothetical protein [Stappia indica]MCC4245770.1 hypothetical protein [Stappia indica]
MQSLGYSRATAELGVWSALWLEERQLSGIIKLVVYLCLVKDIPFEELKPRRDRELGLKGICPFMLAEALVQLSDHWTLKNGVICGAPAEVNLAMASLADWVGLRNQSLRLTHLDCQCRYSTDGWELESGDATRFGGVHPSSQHSMTVELCDGFSPLNTRRKLKEIELPRRRLQKSGLLDLS